MAIRIFLLFWSVMIFGFDYLLVGPMSQQFRSEHYATTIATIESCQVRSARGSKGSTTYSVSLAYTFQVDGQPHRGDKLRYGALSSSDHDWAASFVEQHPPGSQVAVYYDPSNPEEAVLERGIQGMDLFVLLFLAPFNAIALVGLLGGLSGKAQHADGGPLVSEGSPGLIQRTAGALLVGVGSVGCLAFPLIFVVAFGLGMHPSITVMKGIWGLLGLVAAYLALTTFARPGLSGIVLDRNRDELTLPDGDKRRTLGLNSPRACTLSKTQQEQGVWYKVQLDCQGEPVLVDESSSPDRAERLARELSQKLRIPLQKTESELPVETT